MFPERRAVEGSCGGPGGEEGELVGGVAAFLDAVGGDGQPWFSGELEHVEGDVDLADLGMAVDLAPGAVLVDVPVGPVLANCRLSVDSSPIRAVRSLSSGSRPASRRSMAAVMLRASGQSTWKSFARG
jgi:hypothetical protein